MTDLEIKQLCAEAMGIWHCLDTDTDFVGKNPIQGTTITYDPFNNDAQAMALDSVMIDDDHSISFHPRWFARHEYPSGVHTFEFNGAMRDPAQRRRARCECVAMMWLARKGPRRPSTKAKIPTVPYATKLWLAMERKDE
jgi:hypothetical protein